MTDNRQSMVLASFIADALALGVHWVYNTRVIDKKFGVVEQYYDPLTSYHTGKKKGEFTHYGDQMMVLLNSLKANSGFDLDHFGAAWRTFFDTYAGYFDQATKATLNNLATGKSFQECGSSSDDLGGAARIAPLVYAYPDDPSKLVQAARSQTAMTHNSAAVIDSAEFFSRAALRVLEGKPPSQAIDETAAAHFKGNPLEELLSAAKQSVKKDTRQAIADFGQMCEIDAAFPATLHLILKYEADYRMAMVENVMAGGDSAARGMLAGLILGAYHGTEAIPEAWLSGLVQRDRITAAMEKLDKK